MSQPDKILPELLLITGYPRSGTTMLNRLCNNHPDIMLTFEFHNLALPQGFIAHVRMLRKDWRQKWPIIVPDDKAKRHRLVSFVFLMKYLFWLLIYSRGGTITSEIMQKTLHRIFPNHRMVGDKFPPYWNLSNFDQPNTKYVFIYRDARDVTQSFLVQFRKSWKNQAWAQRHFDTAEKIAARWVKAIEKMETYQDRLHIIRYETLVNNPEAEFTRLAEYLGVDPAGFDYSEVKNTSVGKHKEGLTAEELAEVMAVAGPTMQRLGYS